MIIIIATIITMNVLVVIMHTVTSLIELPTTYRNQLVHMLSHVFVALRSWCLGLLEFFRAGNPATLGGLGFRFSGFQIKYVTSPAGSGVKGTLKKNDHRA